MKLVNNKKSKATLLLTVLASALALSACQNAPDTNTADKKTDSQSQTAVTNFTCDNQMYIKAHYSIATENQDALAFLNIDGTEHLMDISKSASGEIYQTDQGLTEGKGLMWSVKGSDAILESYDVANPEDQAAIKTIATCQLKQN